MASDRDNILSVFSCNHPYCYQNKISPVWAYFHTTLTICLNFSNFLMWKCGNKFGTKFGPFLTHKYNFLDVGAKMRKKKTSTFVNFLRISKPLLDYLTNIALDIGQPKEQLLQQQPQKQVGSGPAMIYRDDLVFSCGTGGHQRYS